MSPKTEEIIRKINGTMAMEGMPLTFEDKERLRKCIEGESTIEIEKKRILNRVRNANNV